MSDASIPAVEASSRLDRCSGWPRRIIVIVLVASLFVNISYCLFDLLGSWFSSSSGTGLIPYIAAASLFSYAAYGGGRRKWSTPVVAASVAPSALVATGLIAGILWIEVFHG